MRLISNQMRFILAVVSGELVISNRKKADIVADLEQQGYDPMPANKKACTLFNHKYLPAVSSFARVSFATHYL